MLLLISGRMRQGIQTQACYNNLLQLRASQAPVAGRPRTLKRIPCTAGVLLVEQYISLSLGQISAAFLSGGMEPVFASSYSAIILVFLTCVKCSHNRTHAP